VEISKLYQSFFAGLPFQKIRSTMKEKAKKINQVNSQNQRVVVAAVADDW